MAYHLVVRAAMALALLLPTSPVLAQGDAPATAVVEIRSYHLQPGTRDRFQALFEREALPMLRRWKMDVVAYGPSLHDDDSWFLMRGFSDVDARRRMSDAFYGSDEWISGPRDAILAFIDSYATVVIAVDEVTLSGLRNVRGR